MTTTAIGRAVARRGKDWLAAVASPATDLIDLSRDEISGSTPAAVRRGTIDAVEKHRGDHYTRRPGVAALCKAVADRLATHGIKVDPDTGVVITGGIRETRFVALRALAAGKAIYLPQPSVASHYTPAARLAGIDIQFFDPASDLPGDKTQVLVLPNPNPATGQLYSAKILDRLATWSADAGLTVVADEIVAPLLKPERAYTPFAAWPDMAERTLTLGGFANVPGLAAWQVSWFAGPKELAEPVRDLKQAMTICSPAASQYAALAGVSSGNQELVVQNVERLESITGLLQRWDIPYAEPHTVAFVVADVGELGGGDTVTATCLEHGVQVLSGSGFGRPNSVRITVDSYHFGEALNRLEAALMMLKGKIA